MKALLRVTKRHRTACSMALVIMAVFFVSCGDDDEIVNPAVIQPPSNVTAVVEAETAVMLSWTNVEAERIGVRIQRAVGSEPSATFVSIKTTEKDENSYLDVEDLVRNETYQYRLVTLGTDRESEPSELVIAKTSVPDPPANLDVTKISEDEARAILEWEDKSHGEKGFIVVGRKRNLDGTTFTEVFSDNTGPNETIFEATGLELRNTYAFDVKAFNPLGSSEVDTEQYRTPERPNQPTDFEVETLNCDSDPPELVVTWLDNSMVEKGYLIERSLFGDWFTHVTAGGNEEGTGRVSLQIPHTTLPLRVKARGPILESFSLSNKLLIDPCP